MQRRCSAGDGIEGRKELVDLKLTHPVFNERYVNREFSWLQFNARVLAEAANPDNPLLERLKFLAIFESNLDEFYMVRVSGLIEQDESGYTERTPDGLTPHEQLALIAEVVRPMRKDASQIWESDLREQLGAAGIQILDMSDLSPSSREELDRYFEHDLFPLCTPLLIEPVITFPFMSNRSLNLAVELEDESGSKLARVKVPTVVGRAVSVPDRPGCFVLLEDLIAANLAHLFPGVVVKSSHLFRVVRDADIEIRELEAADLISAVEQTLRLRRYGDPVFLEIQSTLPERWVDVLKKGLELADDDVFVIDGRIGMDFLWELQSLDRPDLKFPLHRPDFPEALRDSEQLFEAIRLKDRLLHHPYDSFGPVLTFVSSGANDPHVIGVKQTLYRVGAESPVVESLLAAADLGKQVAVMVELKARFDENNNLVWSRALERAGVHVSYGMMDMKVHCKLCLVVRKEPDGIHTYVHIGTGNYNPSTALIYTDLGVFSDDTEIVQDVTELFNYLTGFSKQTSYRKLLVAPLNLREGIIELIEQEIGHHEQTGRGRINIKVNSLVDPEVIDALYEASRAGVQVNLIVRGICCLRPGVAGLSENIRVVSVVGRFLEHSRVYVFDRGGADPVAYVGSADMMRRNLDRRIEVLAPVSDRDMVEYLRETVIGSALRDTVKAWEGASDGTYRRVESEEIFSSQDALMSLSASRCLSDDP